MSLDGDDEILQDFIIEAGEILELLSGQLVQLEKSPTDTNLLNAIFRGFHTIKGGAGFLSLNNLVNICHISENVFDILRQGKRKVDAGLMDSILKAVDTVNSMFATVKQGQNPEPAKQSLLDSLELLTKIDTAKKLEHTEATVSESQATMVESTPKQDIVVTTEPKIETALDHPIPVVTEVVEKSQPMIADITNKKEDNLNNKAPVQSEYKPDEDITEEEFDALLDSLHGTHIIKETITSIKPIANEKITEKEFDKLLDSLSTEHKNDNTLKDVDINNVPTSANEVTNDIKAQDELITEEEFEALLDDLAQKAEQDEIHQEKPAITESATVSKSVESHVDIIESNQPIKPVEEKVAIKVVANKTPVMPSNSQSTTVASSFVKSEVVQQIVDPKQGESTNDGQVKKDSKNVGPTIETTVRVDTNRLDQIMNMVGELVLVRNRLVKLKSNSNNADIIKTVGTLDLVTADLQVAVMKTRMQPIKKVFGRFPRVVRDLARSLQKEIVLEMIGEDTDLDKNLVEALADPLVHLVRNSVDHGIETPEMRANNGKPKAGKILLSAAQEGDHIVLSIEDDGKGMDPDELRKSAVEKGIMNKDTADRLNANECFELIFIPGFSTKAEVSDISGRGVGMDVVKTRISQLNGSVEVLSVKGQGTKINIKVPLTLAILPTLMVVVGQQPFALPLACVNEIFDLNIDNTNMVDGQLVVVVRNKAMPLFYLKDWLVNNENLTEQESLQHVVVVSVGIQKIGLVVDKLLGQEEVVIKALGNMLHGTAGIAGATITGDGNIAMILDVPSLLKKYAGKSRRRLACL